MDNPIGTDDPGVAAQCLLRRFTLAFCLRTLLLLRTYLSLNHFPFLPAAAGLNIHFDVVLVESSSREFERVMINYAAYI